MGSLKAIACISLALAIEVASLTTDSNRFQSVAQAQEPVNAETSAPASSAEKQLQQGMEQSDQSQYELALQSFQNAVASYRANRDRLGEGEAIRQMGRVYFALEKYPDALSHFQQSLEIARAVQNRKGEGRTLGNIGAAYFNSKEEDQAISYLKQSIQIAKDVGDLYGEAISQNNLGLLFSTRTGTNDFAETYTAYNRSLELWRTLKDRREEASLLLTLGNFYKRWSSSGRCSSAIEVFEQSLPLLRGLKDRIGEGVALGGLGACYDHQDKYLEAVDYLKQSLAIAREVKSLRNEGIALNDLARTYAKVLELNQSYPITVEELYATLNHPQTALQYGEQGLKIARDTKDQWGEAIALENLGRIDVASGNPRQAISYFDRRLVITRTLKNTSAEADTLNALGLAYSTLKNYPKAIDNHQQAVAIHRPRQERYAQNLQKTAEKYQSKTKSPPLLDFRESLSDLGDAYHKSGNDAKAIQAYQEAFGPPLAERSGSNSTDTKLLGKLGESFAQSGQLSNAEANFRQALKMDEDSRLAWSYGVSSSGELTDLQRIRLAERQAQNYRQLQQVLVRQNKTDAALEVAEQARSRTLVELLTARQKGSSLTQLAVPPKKQSRHSDRYPHSLNGLSHIASQPSLYDAPPLNLEQIRQVANQQNATLVQYSLINDQLLYTWVIQPSGKITFRSVALDPAVSINQQIADSRSAIGARGRISVVHKGAKQVKGDAHLSQLHRILVEPITDQLPQDPNQRVVFLPQGPLYFVPFPALRDAQGKYLIENHTISTAPSIQTLELTQAKNKQPRANGNALVVGDPTMPWFESAQLPALPGARQEAIAIANILKTQPLIGDRATKTAVLEQIKTASTIHLATHGLLSKVSGDAPGAVALAPSGQDKGFLTASEIFNLNLNANLVVLSACDTARGEVTSDGVVGLSRSLIAAGVPSVVVSLWAVDDQSTSALMGDFYRNLQTNPDKARAMRQAMLTTMQQYPNPLDWAAFTLVGESE